MFMARIFRARRMATLLTRCLAILLMLWGLTGEIVLAEVDWTLWNTYGGGVAAVISQVSGPAGGIDVRVDGVFNPAPLIGTMSDPNYWAQFPATYSAASAGISGPTQSHMVRLTGGPGTGTYRLTFSQPVTNPVMAIASLGGIAPAQFDFGGQPFEILAQGPGAWGAGSQFVKTGNVLHGHESNGLIRLLGTFNVVFFTLPTAENWFGFTVGLVRAATPPVVPTNLIAGLEWEYAQPADPEAQAAGFRLYRGLGERCAQVEPLGQWRADVDVLERTYTDFAVPVESGPLCYELTAWNGAGESAHSNRAVVDAETLAPAMPQGLAIGLLN